MSDAEFKEPTSDHRGYAELARASNDLKQSGETYDHSVLHRMFFAGWNARFNVAMSVVRQPLDDTTSDHAVIRDHIKSLYQALEKTHGDYFQYYQRNYQLTALLRDLRLSIKTMKEDDGTIQAWKRVSMQRKELRALLKYSAYQETVIHLRQTRISELEAEIEKLKETKA